MKCNMLHILWGYIMVHSVYRVYTRVSIWYIHEWPEGTSEYIICSQEYNTIFRMNHYMILLSHPTVVIHVYWLWRIMGYIYPLMTSQLQTNLNSCISGWGVVYAPRELYIVLRSCIRWVYIFIGCICQLYNAIIQLYKALRVG